MTSRICWLFLLLMLFTVPAYADPVTVTFNPVVGGSGFVTSYTEQGFNFTGNMFIVGPTLSGNIFLENDSRHETRPNTIRIDFGGGAFDFHRADLFYSFGTNVTGGGSNFFRGSNGVVFNFGLTNGLIEPPQGLFADIIWLEWTHYGCGGEPGPCMAGMDNFRFNTNSQTSPTPEPATLLLLGSGLLGVMKVTGKRRRA